jgi:SAM-dependent methyltransferase
MPGYESRPGNKETVIPGTHLSSGEQILASDYSFVRYLDAKKNVDDRALNARVWQTLVESLPIHPSNRPLQVLEIGAGTGTMLQRALLWGLLDRADYTALDQDPVSIAHALERLPRWGKEQGYQVTEIPGGWSFERGPLRVNAIIHQADLFDFMERRSETGRQAWDLLIAHAFLDLVDIASTLPFLLELLEPEGLFYFTLNFDGATLFEPPIDPTFDEQIEALYHQTMDRRVAEGRPSGDSRTGRRLFAHLKAAGAEILAAGSSDWVVFPGINGYVDDEAYFLHFILHTVHKALQGHPDLDPARFERWIAGRQAQIERRELVYIAHQLDFVGKRIAPALPG